MYDVVTFGETMIRLSTPHFQRLEQTQSLDVHAGGAELNVAVGVTAGLKSAWVSKLPKNKLGYFIRNSPRRSGRLLHVVWSDVGRVGLYFVGMGHPRASSVLYDRSGSAISMVQRRNRLGKVFNGTNIFM